MSGWRPILDGELGARARAWVDEIGAALREPDLDDADLGVGTTGCAIFFAYLAAAFPDQGHGEVAERLLDRGLEAVAAAPMSPSLFHGYTGIAWAYEHLQGRLLEPADEDVGAAIDEALADVLKVSPWPQHDLVSGLAGIAVHVAERRDRPLAATCAARIVDRLGELAIREGAGVTWATPGRDGHRDLGLAHGVPGIVAALAALISAGLGGDGARPLLDDAVAWLLAQRRADDGGSAFGFSVEPNAAPRSCRSAWCYGDPGIACALLGAARAAGRRDWADQAIAIARRDARRPIADARVVDTGVCHGAAGLGHLYARLGHASDDDELRAAARAWFERALALRRPDGVAGCYAFCAPPGDPDGDATWVPDAGLVTGAAGTGLALLAAITSIEPAWDRLLLVGPVS